MNKTINSVIFVVAASAVNIIIMLSILVIPQVVIIAIFRDAIKDIIVYIQIVLFPAAFLGGFYLYNLLLNFVKTKFKLENYIHTALLGTGKPKEQKRD